MRLLVAGSKVALETFAHGAGAVDDVGAGVVLERDEPRLDGEWVMAGERGPGSRWSAREGSEDERP